jgi:hypothetical protein
MPSKFKNRAIYDSPVHRRLRKALRPVVDSGLSVCVRCGAPIAPGELWHLDHDDLDKRRHLGPSHARCNLRAAGLKSSGRSLAVSRLW